MGKLLPILLALIGLGAGAGAGLALRPEPAAHDEANECPCDCTAMTTATPASAKAHADPEDSTTDFVKLSNQFVVPVVKDEDVASLVVLSLNLEVPTGGAEQVYQREPKLRDAFLQVLFDHANTGGFEGAFTSGPNMQILRTALFEVARGQLGETVVDVLITDIVRQDM